MTSDGKDKSLIMMSESIVGQIDLGENESKPTVEAVETVEDAEITETDSIYDSQGPVGTPLCTIELENFTVSFRLMSMKVEKTLTMLEVITPSREALRRILSEEPSRVEITHVDDDPILDFDTRALRCAREVAFLDGFYSLILTFE